MASITRQHVGKYTYLYESVSFRDELGRPRNKKTKIGKLDLKTGLPVYLPEYLERMAAQGTPVEVPQLPEKEPENDWNKVVEQTLDSVKSYGAFHLFHELTSAMRSSVWPASWWNPMNRSCIAKTGRPGPLRCQSERCLPNGSVSFFRKSQWNKGTRSIRRGISGTRKTDILLWTSPPSPPTRN